MRFQILDEDKKGYLTRGDFMKINTLSSNPLVFRIINVFFKQNRPVTKSGRLYNLYIRSKYSRNLHYYVCVCVCVLHIS